MTTCGSCGTANPADNSFCGSCGSPLAATCPSCAATVPPGNAFCGKCGTAMGAAPSTPVPTLERRVCSVLFADLVGFTPLSEARDPEEVRALLSRYFETARTVIARYGGVVEKFIGDAVMAVWGTPVATEGDAERAVRAALDLVAQVAQLGEEVDAPGLALRAGVVTGEVAATMGAVGEGMVAGDAVNTAARVQSAAEPGSVWVDSTTQRLSSSAIGFSEAGEHALKGKSEPMVLWQATRVLGNVGGTQRIDGLEAPMVGRGPEERTLRELFHASIDRRTPRLVVVSGAAGSGKSRLGWEFETYVDGLAFSVNWHRGRCLSYGDGVSYWALAEAVRQRFGIAEEDPVEVATAAFLTRLPELVPDEAERTFVGVRLGRLLGLEHPADPGTDLPRDELFAGWRLFLERLADEAPVVLLVEDGQHADEGLLDFLEQVVDWSRSSPIYTVLFTRSDLLDERPGLGTGRNRALLTLDALDDRSMHQLVEALVRDLPGAAADAIVAQAEGNPLFAVETVRSLVDRDVIMAVDGEYRCVGEVGELTVPDGLHGLLAARLDTLDPALRSLVADAAVVGSTFPPEALVSVSGLSAAEITTSLAELVRRGVLQVTTDPLSPQRGSYGFAQGLLRQVAYDTLSRADRRTRHLAVAEHLQRVFADGGEEVMDVVARHYLDALDATAEADADRGEITELAVASLVRAAERAARSGAPDRAAQQLARAAGLRGESGEAALLWERSGAAAYDADKYDDQLLAADHAERLFETLGDGPGRTRSRVLASRALYRQRRHSEARALLDTILPALRREPGLDTVTALELLINVETFSGRSEEAGTVADEALVLAQSLVVPLALQGKLLTSAGTARLFAGRVLEANALLRHAMVVSATAGDRPGRCRAAINLASVLLPLDPSESVAIARDTLPDARRLGSAALLGMTLANVVTGLLVAGRWDEAEEAAGEIDPDVQDGEVLLLLRMVQNLRGRELIPEPPELEEYRTGEDAQDVVAVAGHDVLLAVREGHWRDAVAGGQVLVDQADLSETTLLAWPAAVRAAVVLGDLEAARDLVTGVESLPSGLVPPRLHADVLLARAVLASYDGQDADQLFADALAQLRDAPSPHDLAHGLLDHADHLRRTGRTPTTEESEAAEIAERLGAVDLVRRIGATVPTG